MACSNSRGQCTVEVIVVFFWLVTVILFTVNALSLKSRHLYRSVQLSEERR